ncbi:MAG: DNA translocase FtsK, partial [Oscillospiraceae bacterium]
MANKSAAKKRGRPSKKTAKKAEINRSWSIVMFAVGILVLALCIVKGSNLWTGIRTFLFGTFGFTSYIIGPILVYLAILTATDKPVKWKMVQSAGFALLTSAFVQIFFAADITQTGFFKMMGALYTQGTKDLLSGGVISGVIASPMLILFGDVPSKITVTVLAVVFFMFLTDTTPYDIYKRTSEEAVKQKQGLENKVQENKVQRQEQKAKREEQRLLQEQESSKAKKIDFEIDEPIAAKDDVGIVETVDESFVETFDEVEKQKQLEHQKIEDIMKKLNLTSIQAQDTALEARAEAPLVEVLPQSEVTEAEKQDTEPQQAAAGAGVAVYKYKHPPISLFEKGVSKNQGDVEKELKTNAQLLVSTLESFGVKTKIIDISRGPSVTRYELQPLAGVKISKITSLADDIALNLASSGVRIEAPIPNKAAVGIEVPNKTSNAVNIRTIFESQRFKEMTSPLSIALGVDIAGNVVVADLTK